MRIAFTTPAWAVVLACVSALAVWVAIARAKTLPVSARVLRAAAVLALLALALGPELIAVRQYSKYPRLAVLADASVYMKGPSGVSGVNKYRQAVDWCRDHRAELAKFSEPVFFRFDKELTPLDLDAPGAPGTGASDIAAAIERAAMEGNPPPSRILVITDGISRAERAAAQLPKTFVPVDFMAVGVLATARDLRVSGVKYSDFAFLHLPQKIEVSLTARGLKGRAVSAVITENGKQLVAATATPARDYEVITATLTVRPESLGPKKAVLKITAPGVASVSRELNWQVIHEKRRVMYLCGRPSADYSLLRDFIKSDPNNELVTFVILRNPENYLPSVENDLSLIQFPADQIFIKDLNLFDVVILDNFSFNRLGLPPQYASSLAEFVKKGGALIAMGTDNIFSPQLNPPALFEMLPVELPLRPDAFNDWLVKFIPQDHVITDLMGGKTESEILWSQLAPVHGTTVFPSLKKGAEQVFTGIAPDSKKYPMAAVWRYGRGRVMAMGTSSTWRWKMLAAGNPAAANGYSLFWTRTLEYMNGGLDIKPVTVSADSSALVEGETGVFTLTVLGRDRNPLNDPLAAVTADAAAAGGVKTRLIFRFERPGVFRAELPELPQGRVTVSAAAMSNGALLGSDTQVFSVRARGSDLSDIAVIDSLAAGLGGRVFMPSGFEPDMIANQLPRPEAAEEIVSRKSLNGVWAAGAFALALLALEWIIRRRRGIL